MSVAYRSTCRPTIGQPLSVDISTDISVECQSTYRPMLDRYVGRYIERHISVDMSTDTRPICRLAYRSTLGRYVDRYVSRLLVNMSTDMSVEGCTKYTWSQLFVFKEKPRFNKGNWKRHSAEKNLSAPSRNVFQIDEWKYNFVACNLQLLSVILSHGRQES